jgi:hypothetical protein
MGGPQGTIKTRATMRTTVAMAVVITAITLVEGRAVLRPMEPGEMVLAGSLSVAPVKATLNLNPRGMLAPHAAGAASSAGLEDDDNA